jgi:hypothetical protein
MRLAVLGVVTGQSCSDPPSVRYAGVARPPVRLVCDLMTARWTSGQVEGLAPDRSSIQAARTLATPRPWSVTGCDDGAVWGDCQGSGGRLYQVIVDLVGPAYRCSCPSRKIPCKHALALLLLWAGGHIEPSQGTAAAEQWLDERYAVGPGTPFACHQGETVTPPHSSGSTSRTVWVSSHR